MSLGGEPLSTLTVDLLGRFESSLGGRPLVKFRTSRVQALLAYLSTEFALGAGRQQREVLMELLWPGMPPKSARTNLRQNLYYLRQTIPDLPVSDGEDAVPFLLADRQAVAINPAYPMILDVAHFCRLLAGPQEEWPEAIQLYRGDFLADFYLPDSSPFEEWAVARRSAFRRQALEALEVLADSAVKLGQLKTAEHYSRRQLEIDPLAEGAFRSLMRLLTWSGRQGEALVIYEECVRLLEDELGSPPSEATITLAETIKKGNLEAPADIEDSIDWVAVPSFEPPPCPYRGLFAFGEEDAPFFFGREEMTERIATAATAKPLVAVIGSSGSGKSSILAAGLIAALRQREGWVIASFRPGRDPFRTLATTLLPVLDSELSETDRLVEAGKLAGAFRDGSLGLNDVTGRILAKYGKGSRLLIVTDQFEELFTLCPDRELRAEFLSLLVSAVQAQAFSPEPALTIALGVRADFLEQALAHRPFADALQDAAQILGPMTREELAAAIEKPAENQAVSFESGLVERILDDVGFEPGNLPLLEFALTEMWPHQFRRQMTHEAYELIGRVEGALANHANEVYQGLGRSEQKKARLIFVQLVRPGEQTDDTRRLAHRSELPDDWPLVQRLADARLVVTGRDPTGEETVEVVHEALIGSWDRYQEWLLEDRAFRTWQERLRAALRQWQVSDEDEGALLRGGPLAEAESWQEEYGDRLSPAEREYIRASQVFHDERIAEREEARNARERTRQRILLGLAAGLVVALILLAFAGWQWRGANLAKDDAQQARASADNARAEAEQAQADAEVERDRTRAALAKSLASQSGLFLDEALDLSLLLGVEATNIDPAVESRGALLTALSESPRLVSFLQGHEDEVRSVAISPDSRTLASGSADGSLLLWDLENGLLLDSIEGHVDSVEALSFSPDGRILASGSFDDSIILSDVSSGQEIARLEEHADNIWSVAFSPDGALLASGDAGGNIILWDTDAASGSFGASIAPPIGGHDGAVAGLAFDGDVKRLASAGADGIINLWDVSTLEDLDVSNVDPSGTLFNNHGGFVRGIAFSPDGRILASGGHDGNIILWDSAPGSDGYGEQIGQPLADHEDWVTSLAFSPDGDYLASTGRDNLVILWDMTPLLESGRAPTGEALTGHQDSVWAVAFGPDGNRLVSGAGDSNVILWDVMASHPIAREFAGHEDDISDLAISPDGSTLTTASEDGTFIFWDVSTGDLVLPPITAGQSEVHSLAFSPDGRVLATGSLDGMIQFWGAERNAITFGEEIGAPLETNHPDLFFLTFSPDGQLLASAGPDKSIALWDMDASSPTFGQPQSEPLTGHEGVVIRAEFNSTGNKLVTTSLVDVYFWDLSSLPVRGECFEPQREWAQGDVELMGYSSRDAVIALGFGANVSFWDVSGESPKHWKLLGEPIPTRFQGDLFRGKLIHDGQTLAVGDGNDLILLDVATRQRIGPPLSLHNARIMSIDESLDGTLVATGGLDGSLILWDADVDSWKAHACRRANRNLTPEEWRRFFGEEPYHATCPELPAAASE
jgi:WD40 repeat protein/DNA-binding SARP family transcriptional activator